MNGKGDKTRPQCVSNKKYTNNWNKAFGKRKSTTKSNK